MTTPEPPELPVQLRRFDPTEWGVQPEDLIGNDLFARAYGRWKKARLTWARTYGVDPKTLPKTGPPPYPVIYTVHEG